MTCDGDRRRLPVFFYCMEAGHEPVRDWLNELDWQDRKTIATNLRRVQEQWLNGMPVCRTLGKGLWEVRTNLSSNRTARVLIFVDEESIGVVHASLRRLARHPRSTLSWPDQERT